jgi:hypothetical protein
MCVEGCLHLITIAEIAQPVLVMLARSTCVSQQFLRRGIAHYLPRLALQKFSKLYLIPSVSFHASFSASEMRIWTAQLLHLIQ